MKPTTQLCKIIGLLILALIYWGCQTKDLKYNRKAWGDWWVIDGVNNRHRLLAKTSINPVKRKGVYVEEGKWKSPYSGETITNPRKLQIDHLVAVHEAWQSGGCLWSKSEKENYMNDQKQAGNLVPVEDYINREKSSKDPAEWLPSIKQKWYIEKWVKVKRLYNLSIDNREKQTIERYGVSTDGLIVEKEETQCKP